jgi:methylated-DNA-[protein]-cysteine S-methyltransferase
VKATGCDIVMDTPLGRLGIRLQGERVAAVEFLEARVQLKPAATPFARRVESAISRWLQDAGSPLALPLTPAGSDFQARVREALLAIPPGEVRSYSELARQLGSSARAVGGACRRNPVPILVPCHRVVGAAGPGGYGGHTGGTALQRKLWLLRHEGVLADGA